MSNPNNKRPSGLFISFNDSSKDPTYASLEDCTIVHGYDDGDNPCSEDSIIEDCPVAPQNLEEMKAFAKMMGWGIEFDNDGQAILYTGVYDKAQNSQEDELE